MTAPGHHALAVLETINESTTAVMYYAHLLRVYYKIKCSPVIWSTDICFQQHTHRHSVRVSSAWTETVTQTGSIAD